MLYSHLQHHNNTIIKQTQGQRRKKTSLEKYFPVTLLQGFERVVQGLHGRGCWRPNIHFIFWPDCYDRHVVSFLFSWFWGPLHRGFRGPLGRVWPSLPHLVSSCLEFCWQLHRGFQRYPSVGCGLPYHISSLTLWESAGNCFWHPKLNWVK